MSMPPVIAALRKHIPSVVLITLQVALTLAIVSNAMYIISQRVQRIDRPTGIKEQNLFLISQYWADPPTGTDPASIEKLDAMQRTDLATLRQLPDVESAASVLSVPLLNSAWIGGIALKPDQHQPTAHVAYYFGGEQMMRTLGVRLIAGHAFTPGDFTHRGFQGRTRPAVTIITKALADRLFPGGDAVGKSIYFDGGSAPTTVIGVIERLEIPSTGSWANGFTWYSLLVPTTLDAVFSRYAVRAKTGRLDEAMREARKALYAVNPMRSIDDGAGAQNGVRAFSDIRAEAYRADRALAIIMVTICVILLCLTGAGIFGLTSFWVGQRRKQIGVRRALGARKVDILHYFQAENLMIIGAGALVGIVLAVGLNLWIMRYFEMGHIPIEYVFYGVIIIFALGQAAVFGPALRASNVPPAEATRTV